MEGLIMQQCLMGRLVKNRMRWAGHVERWRTITHQGWPMPTRIREGGGQEDREGYQEDIGGRRGLVGCLNDNCVTVCMVALSAP